MEDGASLSKVTEDLTATVAKHNKVIECLSNIQKRYSTLQDEGDAVNPIRISQSENEIDEKTILHEVLQKLPEEMVLVFTGELNAGKSTLVNQFLRSTGDASTELLTLPVHENPTTARLTRLVHSERPFLKVLNANGELIGEPEHNENIDFTKIVLGGANAGHLRGDRSELSSVVEIGWQHPLLHAGLVLYDMPGLGETVVMDETVNSFFKEFNTCFMLYVLDGQKGVMESDKNAIKKLREYSSVRGDSKTMFLVNKLDYDVKKAIRDLDDCQFEDVDYDTDNETNEECRENAIHVCIESDKLKAPSVRVEEAKKKLKDYNENDKSLVVPVSGECLKKFHDGDSLHKDEQHLVGETIGMMEKLTHVIDQESNAVFLSVTRRLTALLEPIYKQVSIEVGFASRDKDNVANIKKEMTDYLVNLFEKLETMLQGFEWRKKMLDFFNGNTFKRHSKDFTARYIRLDFVQINEHLTLYQEREDIINKIGRLCQENEAECRRIMIFLINLCDNIGVLSLLKLEKLLKTHKEEQWQNISDESSSFDSSSHGHDVLSDGRPIAQSKFSFKSIYITALLKEFRRRHKFQEIADKFLKQYLSSPDIQRELQTLCCDSTKTTNDKIAMLQSTFLQSMEFMQWETLVGKQGILEKFLYKINENLVDCHYTWCAAVKKQERQWQKKAQEETSKLVKVQKVRQDTSRLLIEIYALEYQQTRSIPDLEEVKDNMKKLADGQESTIYQFQMTKHAQKKALRKISMAEMSAERVHKNCSHLIKSRWLDQRRLPEEVAEKYLTTKEEIAKAKRHILLVMWWLYDLQVECLYVATKVAGDNLAQHLKKNPHLSLADRLEYGRQLILAVQLLHDTEICHGDLRPEAILMSLPRSDEPDETSRAMLNMAKTPNATRELVLANGEQCKPFHIAPDRYDNLENEDLRQPHHDVFSIGSLLWVLAEGSGEKVPSFFTGVHYSSNPSKTLQDTISNSDHLSLDCPKELSHKDLREQVYNNGIRRCWRCTATEDTTVVLKQVDEMLAAVIDKMNKN